MMHPSAFQIGKKIFDIYWKNEFKRILDVGARDVNGSLRAFCPSGAEYVGVDLEAGPGVDIVLKDPYDYPFPNEHFDLVVSTSCFEHDGMFWLGFLEQLRVLSHSGTLYINAPSNGAYHGYPNDNWRFYPDASLALEAWARRNRQEAFVIESFIAPKIEMGWNDCVMIFQKVVAASRRRRYVFEFFPGSYNIRKFGHQEVLNFSPYSQDEQMIEALTEKVSELSKLVEQLRSGNSS
jgi:SAM-dependent methyltransferase